MASAREGQRKKGLGCYAALGGPPPGRVGLRTQVITFARLEERALCAEDEYLFHLGGGAMAGSHVYRDAVDSNQSRDQPRLDAHDFSG